ncbi:hypothetical protein ElyMa_000588300 [Elysia marginata]|uniref:Uncharacterized protein n=1 Tax=Elysia marginata TaxID=1093978 RepID=A0AAV4G4Z0_9GAST|nr:hypothetical protein ElyMa_000588300 [Elysia marginata]
MRGSIPGRVKLKLVLAADPPNVWHYRVSAKSGRPGVRIMCLDVVYASAPYITSPKAWSGAQELRHVTGELDCDVMELSLLPLLGEGELREEADVIDEPEVMELAEVADVAEVVLYSSSGQKVQVERGEILFS